MPPSREQPLPESSGGQGCQERPTCALTSGAPALRTLRDSGGKPSVPGWGALLPQSRKYTECLLCAHLHKTTDGANMFCDKRAKEGTRRHPVVSGGFKPNILSRLFSKI